MAITAALVKELRERTGVGMMECKKALEAVGGDIEAAIEEMRKSGQAKALKKAGRIAAEGMVATCLTENIATILEINCETDFVARDEQFNHFVAAAVKMAAQSKSQNVEQLADAKLNADKTVEQARQELIVKIGENISLRRVDHVKSNNVADYIHLNNKIGVVVALDGGDENLAKDIAMHIAACSPVAITADEVSADVIAKEREIAKAQAEESGKPADIIEKMIEGRINKFLKEVTLLGQPFVKDPNLSIEKLLQQHKASVLKFIRYEVGEGIEKKEEDFVAEVMAQARGGN